jgi:hypothetical protein
VFTRHRWLVRALAAACIVATAVVVQALPAGAAVGTARTLQVR